MTVTERYRDGFEWLGAMSERYTTFGSAPAVQTSGARTGSRCTRPGNTGGGWEKVLAGAFETWMVTTSWRPVTAIVASADTNIIEIRDGATVQFALRFKTDGNFEVRRGTTVLATFTPTAPFVSGTYFAICVAVKIHSSAGEYVVAIDGVVQAVATGVNTQESANASGDRYRFTGPMAASDFDDTEVHRGSGSIYSATFPSVGAMVWSQAGSPFITGVKVPRRQPTGAGNAAVWVRNTGANDWSAVNEAAADGDTTYLSAATVGDKTDLSAAAHGISAGTVTGVQFVARVRRDDVVSRGVTPYMRIGATDYPMTEIVTTQAYVTYIQQADVNPATSNPWTLAEVDTIQPGVEVTT